MARRLYLAVITAIIGTILAGATCAQGEKIDLKLNLKAGQKFNMRLSTSNDGKVKVGKQSVDTNEALVVGMMLSVESVDENGVANLKVTFDRPSYSFTSNMPGANQMSTVSNQAFAALSGKGFSMSLGRDGSVTSLTGLSSAVSSALQSLSASPQAVQTMASSVLNQAFSDVSWRRAMTENFCILPTAPVAVGERWSKALTGDAVGNTYYKIISRANGVCRAKVYTELRSLQKQPSPGVSLSISGISEGTVDIEESTGLLMAGSDRAKLTGKAVTPDGKSCPVTVNSSGRTERY